MTIGPINYFNLITGEQLNNKLLYLRRLIDNLTIVNLIVYTAVYYKYINSI